MPTIGWLLKNSHLPDSPTARLDLELLLAKVLGKPRSYLLTWPERELEPDQYQAFQELLQRRQQGEPVAYLLQQQGFWSMTLEVAPHTLIPRPDTELLVEVALTLPLEPLATVLDLGTGSGAIALALALERPQWQVLGVDRIAEAVSLAERNRQALGLDNVRFRSGSWFAPLQADERFSMIVSNPPYIAADDPHLGQGDVRFEPLSALVSGADGLQDIRHISAHAGTHLRAGGWLLLEHGYDQAAAVRAILQGDGFVEVASHRDLAGHERITLAARPC